MRISSSCLLIALTVWDLYIDLFQGESFFSFQKLKKTELDSER